VEEHAAALEWLLGLFQPTLDDLVEFVDRIEPGAQLRERRGLDVRVGSHVPISGGPEVRRRLEALMGVLATDPFDWHQDYETLHPFTDGNGRSGRAMWAWQMRGRGYRFGLGFLHMWYYQSLSKGRP
jgi:hypothetical protein